MAGLLLAERAIAAIAERLRVLSPERDEALLSEASVADVTLFHAGFTFYGWVAAAQAHF